MNLMQHRVHGVNRGVAFDRQSPGCHFIQHDAERIDVAAMINAFAARLFRRHIGGRAEGRADFGQFVIQVAAI